MSDKKETKAKKSTTEQRLEALEAKVAILAEMTGNTNNIKKVESK